MTQRDIIRLANDLMTQHGLFAQGWTFRLNRAKRQRGVCIFTKRNRRTRTIVPVKRIAVSINMLTLPNAEWEIRNTLLHEIAHALAGADHHHDAVWRSLAQSIGCTGERCGTSMEVAPTYRGTCTKCPATWDRFRVNRRLMETGYHKRCGKDAKIVWSRLK